MVRQAHHNVKIYTKTGDKGETSLFGGQRVSKSDVRVESYGTIDELNSAIGIVLSVTNNKQKTIRKELIKIQNDLFEIGSALANPTSKSIRDLEKRVGEFEKLIDELTSSVPPLQNFILPGGGRGGSLLHFARTVCRRAERWTVALSKKEKVDTNILIYLNRLSDLLFTMARYVNWKEKKKEALWRKPLKV
ncbi:MAG: ATP:cob(I)alamin adenosyltransferase [Candidatus Levybacteria bacterium RIFCSPHIGHO2_02_FULL_42_12]|nr:MAG: ATP:cob(I)alamin adenosyltransferase [Candidatus Levybacteria bacterium RIFCSPHIGHO2_02_FULL_42_12]OGH42036.1 MAG: ATP:cob(I)alamin adenosyltransferase [Candidatus Levybacteria bacterium RIFCSPLOWO2_01_FULL_42_15]